MPPNKGPSMKQRTLNFKSVKQANRLKQNKTATAIKKPRGKAAQNAKLAKCDMHVKLHIPVSICKNLPSVKTNLNVDMKKGVKVSPEQRVMGVYKRHSVSQLAKEELEEENGQLAKLFLVLKGEGASLSNISYICKRRRNSKGWYLTLHSGVQEI